MKKPDWNKYILEFLSIFIAVLSAFALSNWNDNRRDNKAESKIFVEILNGLEKDLQDVKENVRGHEQGIQACAYWSKIFNNSEFNVDSLKQYYFILTRDFVSIQNTSGYETLKSKGLELIQNDSLRTKIISLYEYDYKTLMKLEEEYDELQFQKNYFREINSFIAPHFKFDLNADINGIDLPMNLNKSEKNILLSYLWKIRVNRNFVLNSYSEVEKKIKNLSKEIEKELQR